MKRMVGISGLLLPPILLDFKRRCKTKSGPRTRHASAPGVAFDPDGNDSSYLVTLGPGCVADFDRDGSLTIYDFLTFQNRFQDGDPSADLDGDGELTVLDFLTFQTAFDTGCE